MAGEKAQKRGGGSAGGGSGVNKFLGNSATAGHLHEDEYENTGSDQQKIQWLQEDLGVSEEDAKVISKSMSEFTNFTYTEIRDDQYNNRTWTKEYKYAQNLENFIEKSPKFNRQIFRGIRASEDVRNQIISTLSEGGMIDMRGLSSWSSNKSVAERFSNINYGKSGGIIFELPKGTKAGASIQHLSEFGKRESEVLCSGKVKYSATKIELKELNGVSYYHITLQEHI